MMIPQTLLVAGTAFGERLDAERVTDAIALGLRDGGRPAEACPLAIATAATPGAGIATALESLDFDARMRSARAVVLAAPRLREDTLAGSVTFEIATRARQAGVPAYAVTGEDLLDSFDARILDLQTIVQARTHRSLRSAGRKLATLV
jgi:glycerate 2-kinase